MSIACIPGNEILFNISTISKLIHFGSTSRSMVSCAWQMQEKAYKFCPKQRRFVHGHRFLFQNELPNTFYIFLISVYAYYLLFINTSKITHKLMHQRKKKKSLNTCHFEILFVTQKPILFLDPDIFCCCCSCIRVWSLKVGIQFNHIITLDP